MNQQTAGDHYQNIVADFGFDPAADQEAARLLHSLLEPRDAFRHVGTEIKNRATVTVVGCGPALADLQASDLPEGPIIAADGATERLRELAIVPRVVVTDLDGDPEALQWAARAGASLVIHAHGDNMDRIQDLVPELGPLRCGSYQGPDSRPELEPMRNIGGFTDGDRAVLLCHQFEVRQVNLVAFQFDQQPSRYSHNYDLDTKMRKLAWAKRIVEDAAAAGLHIQHWAF